MNQERKLLGYYNYTVILTYTGMLIGFMGIVYAYEGNILGAVLSLMAAGFCDMFDGTVASTKVRTLRERCFGIQIDSLSDLICFGVLPAVIVYSRNRRDLLVMIVCSLYLLCALIRLAYFNVDEQERQQNSSDPRKTYYGLPVTMSALLLPLAEGAAGMLPWRADNFPAAVLMMMALLFLIPFPLRKPELPGKICVILCGVLGICFVTIAFAGV